MNRPLFITLKSTVTRRTGQTHCRYGHFSPGFAAQNVEPYEELGLAEDKFTDDQLIDFMLQHPILINRPIVVTPLGTRLCRPSEVVLDILPDAQKAHLLRKTARKQ